MEGGAWPRQFNMVSVTCYKKTGFNAVNIPESPAFLTGGTFDSITFDALDILQVEGLSSVSVSASYLDVRDIDYCALSDGTITAYYAVGTPYMTSTDVATLPLTYDGVTSAGGPSALIYLDGVTERHTVAEDKMFEFTQADEYMTPRRSLELEYGGMLFNNTDIVATPVESTLDLVFLGEQFDDDGITFTGTGITFTDASGNKVTTPYTKTVSARTQFTIGDATSGPLAPNTRLYENKDDYPKVVNGLAVVRCLSMENSVISQVAYPEQYISVIIGADGQYSTVTGKDQVATSGLDFKYADVNNNRVLYGEYNKYGLITAAGEKGEYLPEQIGDSTDTTPTVRSIADPRPDGKPYFRFAKYLGSTGNDYFYVSCVSGLEWANVPLVYSKASGTYLNRINFENDAKSAQSAYRYTQASNAVDAAQTAVNGVLGFINAFTDAGPNQTFGGWISGMAQSVSDTGFGLARTAMSASQTRTQYNLAREKELQNYGFSQSVVSPQVLFPFNANLIRDFVGNGVFVYRYRYSNDDVKRIDTLLTMYGYKDTMALSAEQFNNRTYFDYVRALGVSIGGDLPLWQKETIAAQLNAGIRVWHVKPDASYYTSGNPIKTES